MNRLSLLIYGEAAGLAGAWGGAGAAWSDSVLRLPVAPENRKAGARVRTLLDRRTRLAQFTRRVAARPVRAYNALARVEDAALRRSWGKGAKARGLQKKHLKQYEQYKERLHAFLKNSEAHLDLDLHKRLAAKERAPPPVKKEKKAKK